MTGQVVQINISSGGVPKTAIERAVVGEKGIEGDGHSYERHGGPEKALCIYSLERILAFQAAGHPVFPGSLGENLTIIGLEWSEIKPGDRFRVGDEVEIEIVNDTTPCPTIAGSFSDGDVTRLSEELHPGWARYYARVLKGGTILPGALVESL